MFVPYYKEHLLARPQVNFEGNAQDLFDIRDFNEEPAFAGAILKLIQQINNLPPGKELFSRLSTALKGRKITICHGKARNCEEPEYDIETSTVFFSTALKSHYISSDTLHPHPPSITLAHELIHGLHFLENKGEALKRVTETENLKSPLLSNLEEQETILGNMEGQWISLCENTFLAHLNLPLRENHAQGMLLRTSSEGIQLNHLILVRSRLLISQFLEKNPHLLNQLYDNNWMEGIKPEYIGRGKKFHPLTLAFKMGRGFLHVAEELISHPDLDPTVIDHFGGPVVSACSSGHFDMAAALIDKMHGDQSHLKKVLTQLISYWEKSEISDDTQFYDLLIKVDNSIQGSHSYLLDLLTPVSPARSDILLRYLVQANRTDSLGNTVHMKILKGLESMAIGFRKRSGKAAYLRTQVQENKIDLEHRNSAGESFPDIAGTLGIGDTLFMPK